MTLHPALMSPLVLALQGLGLVGLADTGPEQLPYTIVDTGQDTCHDARHTIEAPSRGEAFFGQDAQYSGNAPAYRDAEDGTLVDLNTGLVWQKTPDFVTRSWAQAGEYAEALELGGHSDWRLPSIKELFSRTEREEVQLATGPRAGGALCASWAEGRITASESPKQPQGGPAKAQ
ncbi:MAG: DUF1566 domain-containing protein, partial [Planctomycetota bacterium]|nr:DUF1566 domain-containing protein [Planctomycetota bacterium]